MHYSTILSVLSIATAAQATAIQPIEARNANHISMYDVKDCPDDKKYYKWKSTSTCACVAVDLKAVSIFTDHEPLQNVIAFSDGNCQKVLGPISAKRCLGTLDTFMDGAIESVMFWLPGVCDLKEALGDIVKDVEHVLELGATIG